MRNLYYADSKSLDHSKYITDVEKIIRGDIRNPPEDVTIHYHRYEIPCANEHHVYFAAKDGSEM